MSPDFLSHVPVWVWFVLVALIALGLSATRTRRKSLAAALAMPVAMTIYSCIGATSAFPHLPQAWVAWCGGLLATLGLRASLGMWGRVQWSRAEHCVVMPGSWLPLACILMLFVLKFAVNVLMGMHPMLRDDTMFAVTVSLVYGSFSGVFGGRAVAIWRAVRMAPAGDLRSGRAGQTRPMSE